LSYYCVHCKTHFNPELYDSESLTNYTTAALPFISITKCIWENIKMDLREIEWESVDWMHLRTNGGLL
jgi:hypothetical protein